MQECSEGDSLPDQACGSIGFLLASIDHRPDRAYTCAHFVSEKKRGCRSEKGCLAGDWRVCGVGAVSDLLEVAASSARLAAAGASHCLVVRAAGDRAGRAAAVARFSRRSAPSPYARDLCRRRIAAQRQLGHIRVGGQCRLYRRDQPGLLHQSAVERAAGCDHSARASAAAAVDRGWAGCRRGDLSHPRLRLAAVDCVDAGFLVRPVWPGQEDGATGRAPWPDSGNGTPVRAHAALFDLRGSVAARAPFCTPMAFRPC